MTPIRRAVFDVLNSFRKEGEKWRGSESTKNNAVLQFVNDRFQPILERDLELLLGDGDEGDFNSGKALFLAPSEKEPRSVVVLRCGWKMPNPPKANKKKKAKIKAEEVREVLRMYVGIFRPNADAKADPHFCGLRFETPEGKSAAGRGVHNYYHVQLIEAASFDDCMGSSCTIHVPESYPALPLHVFDLSELAASVYLALHGLDSFLELTTVNPSVNKTIQKMHKRCDAASVTPLTVS